MRGSGRAAAARSPLSPSSTLDLVWYRCPAYLMICQTGPWYRILPNQLYVCSTLEG